VFYCDKLTSPIKSITFLSSKSYERYLIKSDINSMRRLFKSTKRTSAEISPAGTSAYQRTPETSNINVFRK